MPNYKINRLISFLLVAVVVAAGAAVFQYQDAERYRRYAESIHQRAFYDLVDYVKTIDTTLEKGVHTSSEEYLVVLASQVWREASGAKASLGQLPLTAGQADNIAKFLSQAGDYAYMVLKKVVNNEEVSEEEEDTLVSLSKYADQLTQNLLTMENDINSGAMTISAVQKTEEASGESPGNFNTGIGNMETEFQGYPSLIYDGPFSDHIDKLESEMTKNLPEIPQEEAKKAAADFLGLKAGDFKQAYESSGGPLPTWDFGTDTVYIGVTKRGGYPVYMRKYRDVKEQTLTPEEAVAAAKDYLDAKNFKGMKESYYINQGGVLTINFAYMDGDFVCYPDLIKVGVAMDDGEIVSLELRGYLMSHKEKRDIPAVKVSRQEAEGKISKRLTVAEYELAVIPTDFKTEIPCHAFLCTNDDGRKYFVYINIENGREENMLILIESDEGTLTM